jgi:dienelactone hydrolase
MKKNYITILLTSLTLCFSSCHAEMPGGENKSTSSQNQQNNNMTQADEGNTLQEVAYTTGNGETGYVYITSKTLNNRSDLCPLVLVMTFTTGNARNVVEYCGWKETALRENLIIVSPEYNNYATYSETSKIMDAVRYVINNFPVDTTRIYTTGFSNGGATSVAMVSRYPKVFAAMSAMGWMVDMRGQDNSYDIPFQVIQGTREYTYQTASGAWAIMTDEQEAIRSLLLYNEMIASSTKADYDIISFWGYKPDRISSGTTNNKTWTKNDYMKKDYDMPYAQFILIDGAAHVPHSFEGDMAWDFFRHFTRGADGNIHGDNGMTGIKPIKM